MRGEKKERTGTYQQSKKIFSTSEKVRVRYFIEDKRKDSPGYSMLKAIPKIR
jgi:hypothetical protein